MNTSDLDAQLAAGDITQAEYNAAVQAREGINEEVQRGYYDNIIELFELDLRDLGQLDASSQERYYFTNQVLPDGSKIQWRVNDDVGSTTTVVYEPLPIAATNFERTTKGQIPTPELTVSNIFGAWSDLIEDLDDLIGARIVRRRTLVKHLVGQSSENLDSYFPSDIFYIERKIREDNISITFALASPLDLEGLQLPKRIVTQNYCIWKYRGDECGYSGPPVADSFNRDLDGAGDAADEAYTDALAARNQAQADLRKAVATKAEKKAAMDNACGANAAAVETKGGFVESNRNDMYFALPNFVNGEEGNETIMIVWQGGNVTGQDGTGYRADSKRMTTPHDSYGTGPLYAVQRWEEFYPGIYYVVAEEKLDVSGRNSATFALNPNAGTGEEDQFFAVFNGSEVTLTETGEYRLGSQTTTEIHPVYQVDRLDLSACNQATIDYNNAVTAKNAAKVVLDNAQVLLDTAAANLSDNSVLFTKDVCGKQLSSCRLRFSGQDLPFGGFPGANLSR